MAIQPRQRPIIHQKVILLRLTTFIKQVIRPQCFPFHTNWIHVKGNELQVALKRHANLTLPDLRGAIYPRRSYSVSAGRAITGIPIYSQDTPFAHFDWLESFNALIYLVVYPCFWYLWPVDGKSFRQADKMLWNSPGNACGFSFTYCCSHCAPHF